MAPSAPASLSVWHSAQAGVAVANSFLPRAIWAASSAKAGADSRALPSKIVWIRCFIVNMAMGVRARHGLAPCAGSDGSEEKRWRDERAGGAQATVTVTAWSAQLVLL